MGTSNFLYNHKLDVISGTLFSTFDLEAYNKEMDEVDRLKADDYEAIGNILYWNCGKMPSKTYGIELTSLIGSVIHGENTVSTDFESYPQPTQAKTRANI